MSSSITGMPNGKPAGVRCAQLTDNNFCTLFGKPERPAVCVSFPPSPDVCGRSREEAFSLIEELEKYTKPLNYSHERMGWGK